MEEDSTDDSANNSTGAGTSAADKSLLNQLRGLNQRELILAVKKMNPGQKKRLAMQGNAAVRKILMRDPNHDIQLAMVTSPKASEGEIEKLASFASTSEIVLKTIFSTSRWSKSYRIKLALVKNPKTPMVIVTKCLRTLTTHDLKKISLDTSVKKMVSQAASRMIRAKR